MKKTFLSIFILPLVISNTNSANVESIIRNKVSGENTSVKTEVTNIVNQNVTHIESTRPGEIRVEVKDGQTKIETSTESENSHSENLNLRILAVFKDLFSRISAFFNLGS